MWEREESLGFALSGRGGGKMSGGISSNRLLKGYDSKDVFQGLSSFLMGDCNV